MDTPDVKAALAALSFTAIDVETANEQRDSLCAIGMVRFEQGIIAQSFSYRIRPRELRLSIINQQIHKLTETDLKHEPELGDVWNSIEAFLADQVLVAHNASFDVDVLRRSLKLYGIRLPNPKHLCSLKLAGKAFPGLPSYRLKDLADSLGISLNHHDAASDARACALITAKSLPRIDPSKLAWGADELTASFDKIASEQSEDPWDRLFGAKRFDSNLLKPNLDVEDKDNPFYNKRIVFTGDLDSMERSVAAQLVQALGADINVSISKRTNIVIVGRAPGPSKMRKIEDLLADGHEIRIMREKEFLALLPGRKDELR